MTGGDTSSYVNDFVRAHPYSLVAKRHAQILASKTADKTRASIMTFVSMALAPFEYAECSELFTYRYETSYVTKSRAGSQTTQEDESDFEMGA